MTLYDLFRGSVQDFPERTAIICGEKRLTYRQLDAQINELTNDLIKWGIGKGERVGVYFPNCTFYPAMLYALLRIGAVFVPFNIRLSYFETVELIKLTGCSTFIFDRRYVGKEKEDKKHCPSILRWIAGDDEKVDKCNCKPHYELCPGESIDIAGEDEGLIIFTGGTTGNATGVVVTHDALVSRVVMKYRDEQRTMHYDVMLNHSPMFHTGGLSLMIQTLSAGGCFVMSEKFDPDAIIEDCERYQVTQMVLIPPNIIYSIADSPLMSSDKLSSVRLCIVAGGAADSTVVGKIFDTFENASIYLNYGSSENSITLGHIMSRKDFKQKPWRIKSVGIANMASFVRILDENGNEVPTGEVGEAWGKSPAQMKYYLGRDSNAVNGWIPTGDLFRKDEDGYFYFVSRKKNMIKSGGESVYAEEVECVLKQHPDIKDCIVFGLPDRTYGDAVAAAIVPEVGKSLVGEEIVDFVKDRIASYKKPRKLFYVEEFPLTAAGKIARGEFTETLAARKPDYSI